MKEIEDKNFIFSIKEKGKTASLKHQIGNEPIITIPRSINIDSQTYTITSISRKAFQSSKTKSIQFSSNSGLQRIKRYIFDESAIETFSIPASVYELQKG